MAYVVPAELQGALDAVGGDAVLLERIALVFLDQCPGLIVQIRKAIQSGDGAAAAAAAHALSGSLSVLAAHQARDAARTVEQLAMGGDRAALDAAYAALEREVTEVVQTLKGFFGAPPLARPA